MRGRGPALPPPPSTSAGQLSQHSLGALKVRLEPALGHRVN